MNNKLLMVEDNIDTACLIQNFLEESNFDVSLFSTVSDAISNMKFYKYDLILLDLNLPDFNGTEVLKYLNKLQNTTPVIVLSAYSEVSTKLQCFKFGAVDYLIKPIDLKELEARIWVHLGRSTKVEVSKLNKIFRFENEKIFFHNKSIKLTKIEFDILSNLLENQNSLIKREKLVQNLSSSASIRSLDYHIRNIRKKINDDTSNPKYIVTEYGMGYKLIN